MASGDGFGGAVNQLAARLDGRDPRDPALLEALDDAVRRIRSIVQGLNEKRDPRFADRPTVDPDEFASGLRAAVLDRLSEGR